MCTSRRSTPASSPGSGVPVHPLAAPVPQDRTSLAARDGAVDGSGDRGRQRDKDGLAALAVDAQHPVAVFLAEIVDVRAGGFEDPQPEQPEQADQREVVQVGRVPAGGEQRLELQVGQPEGG
jgi:hypothetical protein